MNSFNFFTTLLHMFQKNTYNHEKITIAVIFSAIAAVFSVVWFFFNTTTEQSVLNALNTMEAYKVGGQANRNKLQKLYADPSFATTQWQNIDAALESMGGSAVADDNQNNPNDTVATANTLTEDQIAAVLKDVPLDGNKDSDVVFIEYTDFECPFCQSHFSNGTVATLMKDKNIASTIKQFPLPFHPNAQKAAEGNLCVLSLGDDKKFFEYVEKVFTSKDSSLANITAIAKDLGINEAKFTQCLESNEKAAQVANENKEGSSLFGVNGTPGNVLLNKKTGKYVVVSGAQPLNAFESAYEQIK